MCGRFLLITPEEVLSRVFGYVERPNLAPRYNIAPTQDVPVVRQRRKPQGQRTIQMLRWGLVPSWADSLAGGAKMINARAETVREKPAFRDAFLRRRCLVPADGFYEWRPGDPEKQPFLIARPDRGPIAFAGLWERWTMPRPDGARAGDAPTGDKPHTGDKPYVDSFTIITTDANATLRPLHHRMPVILAPADYATWLDPDSASDDLAALLRPAPDDWLGFAPADRRVNSVRNDDAALLRAPEAATG
jgi:putative SOS response-associated peptidase YedK